MNQEIKDRLNEWVSDHYQWLIGEVNRNIANGKMNEYASDLLHHIIMDLYKMKDEKLEGMLNNGKLKWYVLSGCALQLKSQTSPFYRIHRREKAYARSGVIDDGMYDTKTYEIKDFDAGEDLFECFQRAIGEINWYLSALLKKKIIEGQTYQEMYEFYNISKTHLIKDINQGLKEIRTICNNVKSE